MDQNTNLTNLAKCQMAFLCISVNFIIQKSKFCKIVHIFCQC